MICNSPLPYPDLLYCGADEISFDTSDVWSSAIVAYSNALEISQALEVVRIMGEKGVQIEIEAELRVISAASMDPFTVHFALQRIDLGCKSGRY